MRDIVVYRVQAADGRGPFRPGFSEKWLDENPCGYPSWMEEFGLSILNKIGPRDYCGSACRDLATLRKWFSDGELNRLRLLGYRVVQMQVDRIIAESHRQLVFARAKPLNIEVTEIDAAREAKP